MSEKERRKNTEIGTILCAELLRLHLAQAARIEEAGSNEEPDMVLVVDGQRVLAELTGYRHPSSHVQVEIREQEFTSELREALRSDQSMRGFRLWLTYIQERDSRGKEVYAVPSSGEQGAVVSEIIEMFERVRLLPVWDANVDLDLLFGARVDMDNMNEYPWVGGHLEWGLDDSVYPALTRYFSRIGIRHIGAHRKPSVNSSLNVRHIGGDIGTARALAAAKLRKLPKLRKLANGVPCWLIIHSDGYPMSALLDDEDVPRMCAGVREVLDHADDSHDRAFWLNMGVPVESKRLHAI